MTYNHISVFKEEALWMGLGDLRDFNFLNVRK
jgi:hypothetical protein